MVQLREQKSVVGLSSAQALIFDFVDDDGSVMVNSVKDSLIKVQFEEMEA